MGPHRGPRHAHRKTGSDGRPGPDADGHRAHRNTGSDDPPGPDADGHRRAEPRRAEPRRRCRGGEDRVRIAAGWWLLRATLPGNDHHDRRTAGHRCRGRGHGRGWGHPPADCRRCPSGGDRSAVPAHRPAAARDTGGCPSGACPLGTAPPDCRPVDERLLGRDHCGPDGQTHADHHRRNTGCRTDLARCARDTDDPVLWTGLSTGDLRSSGTGPSRAAHPAGVDGRRTNGPDRHEDCPFPCGPCSTFHCLDAVDPQTTDSRKKADHPDEVDPNDRAHHRTDRHTTARRPDEVDPNNRAHHRTDRHTTARRPDEVDPSNRAHHRTDRRTTARRRGAGDWNRRAARQSPRAARRIGTDRRRRVDHPNGSPGAGSGRPTVRDGEALRHRGRRSRDAAGGCRIGRDQRGTVHHGRNFRCRHPDTRTLGGFPIHSDCPCRLACQSQRPRQPTGPDRSARAGSPDSPGRSSGTAQKLHHQQSTSFGYAKNQGRSLALNSRVTSLGNGVRRCPTLPHRGRCSTIGAEGLSFRVRYGSGRFPFAMAAVTLWNCSTIDGARPVSPWLGGSGFAVWLLFQSRTVDA